MRDAVAILQMARAHDGNHLAGALGGDGFGHRTVPYQLGVDEMGQAVGRHFRAAMARHRVGEVGAVGGAGRGRGADAFALGSRHVGPAIRRGEMHEVAGDIECDHGDVVVAGETEDGHVERRGKTPDVFPVGFFEEFILGEFSSNELIEDGLVAAGEHLEAEDEGGVGGVEAAYGGKLEGMVGRAVVLLAEQHDGLGRGARDGVRHGAEGCW